MTRAVVPKHRQERGRVGPRPLDRLGLERGECGDEGACRGGEGDRVSRKLAGRHGAAFDVITRNCVGNDRRAQETEVRKITRIHECEREQREEREGVG